MKKWMWLTVPATVVVLALGLWGGAVFAQEPVNPQGQVARSGNWTGMADYCRGLMNGTQAVPSVNGTEMHNYCQNTTGMMGSGGMMGMMNGAGGMMGGGMMGGGMMGR